MAISKGGSGKSEKVRECGVRLNFAAPAGSFTARKRTDLPDRRALTGQLNEFAFGLKILMQLLLRLCPANQVALHLIAAFHSQHA